MRLALLRQGLLLVAASPAPTLPSHCRGSRVRAPRRSRRRAPICASSASDDPHSQTDRCQPGGRIPAAPGRSNVIGRDGSLGPRHRCRTAISFAGSCLNSSTAHGCARRRRWMSRLKEPVEPAAVMRRLQSTGWDLGQAA
jgi:hypothetical protein